MDFKGLNLDSILQRLEDPAIEPGFVDPRHSLVFWARPPPHIRKLVSEIQQRLKKLAPSTSISFSYPDRRFFMIAGIFLQASVGTWLYYIGHCGPFSIKAPQISTLAPKIIPNIHKISPSHSTPPPNQPQNPGPILTNPPQTSGSCPSKTST
jgi:hypothetical protein